MIKLGSSAKTKQEHKKQRTQSHSCVSFASRPLLPLFFLMNAYFYLKTSLKLTASKQKITPSSEISSLVPNFPLELSLNNFPRSRLQQILLEDSLRLKKVYFSS